MPPLIDPDRPNGAQMHQQQETRTGMVILSFISLAAPARRGHCKAGR
jgi:hypothetical protein